TTLSSPEVSADESGSLTSNCGDVGGAGALPDSSCSSTRRISRLSQERLGTPCGSKHSSRSATATTTPGTFHDRPHTKRTRCGARLPAIGSPFSASAHSGWVRVRTSTDDGGAATSGGGGPSAVASVVAIAGSSVPGSAVAGSSVVGVSVAGSVGDSPPG